MNTDWAVPEHIVNDWHSDCLFNVFKEYMFQKMLGASYTDAFLSNQIRHELITREKAWEQLIESKKYYAKKLKEILPALDLEHLNHRFDLSCFEVYT